MATSNRGHPEPLPAAGNTDQQHEPGYHPRTARSDPGPLTVPGPAPHNYEFDRPWTIEQAIGYLYSTSLPLHPLLGEHKTAFEQTITDTLLAIDPNGLFTEPVTLEVLTATRG